MGIERLGGFLPLTTATHVDASPEKTSAPVQTSAPHVSGENVSLSTSAAGALHAEATEVPPAAGEKMQEDTGSVAPPATTDTSTPGTSVPTQAPLTVDLIDGRQARDASLPGSLIVVEDEGAISTRTQYEAVVTGMMKEGTTAEERTKLVDAMMAFKLESLQSLLDDGVTICFTGDLPSTERGQYLLDSKEVRISGGVDPALYRETILHEVAHALDARSFREQTGKVGLASDHSPEVDQLFKNHLVQTEVDRAAEMRATLLAIQPEGSDPNGLLSGRLLQGKAVTTIMCAPASLSPTGEDVVALDSKPPGTGDHLKEASGGIRDVALGLAVLAGGVASGGLLLVGMGLAGAALTTFGAIRAVRDFQEARHEARFSLIQAKTTVHLPQGGEAAVAVNEGTTLVQGALPAADAPAFTFSKYARDSRKAYEYVAEGVANYLNTPESREKLTRMDPGLATHIESLGIHKE